MTLFAFGVWWCYLWADSFSPAFFPSGGTKIAVSFLSIGRPYSPQSWLSYAGELHAQKIWGSKTFQWNIEN